VAQHGPRPVSQRVCVCQVQPLLGSLFLSPPVCRCADDIRARDGPRLAA